MKMYTCSMCKPFNSGEIRRCSATLNLELNCKGIATFRYRLIDFNRAKLSPSVTGLVVSYINEVI